jgi:hypothetical protein
LVGSHGRRKTEVSKTVVIALEAFDFLIKLLLGISLLCETEVSNFEGEFVFVNENVVWLNVSVNQALSMDVLEALHQLLEQMEHNAAVWHKVLRINESSKSLSKAVLHLDHYVQSNKVLASVD